jgi:hypothetical protein
MQRDFGLDIPQTLHDVVDPRRLALLVYDLHASLGNLEEARRYLDRALEHQSAPARQALLRRKRAALDCR